MGASNVRKLNLFLVILLLLMVVLYIVYVMPVKSEQSDKQSELNRLTKQLSDLQAVNGSKDRMKEQEMSSLMKVRQQIPERAYPLTFYRDLALLETMLDMKLESYYYLDSGHLGSTASEDAEINPLTQGLHMLRYTGKGDMNYDLLVQFLREAETMNRLYIVEKVEIKNEWESPIRVNAVDKIFEAAITLKTFYAPELKDVFPQPIPEDYVPTQDVQQTPFH
ncbi:hypothetical protein [Marinicrinis sediminis]|uniref:Type IV pilus assembly protein PilO n=1 Tax=Marinicrinis sediminis TaxID=1652465 RepID=A0ABW5RBW6_9BACL